MSLHIVVGAGPVGRETARLLAAGGHEVKIVNRGGTEPLAPGVQGLALDARDARALAEASRGAGAIFMCAMAPYTDWPAGFPPIMDGVVSAAEAVGAKLLIAGNVYGYGEGAPLVLASTTPLAPTTRKGQVRVDMWQRAIAANVQAIEVRASDYLGAGAASLFTLMAVPAIVAGQPAPILGDLDALHAWTFTRDVARTLVAAAAFDGEWGRAFHAPSQYASQRALAHQFAKAAEVAQPSFHVIGEAGLQEMAAGDPLMHEVAEMAYLYGKPLLLDARETEADLGVFASDLSQAINDTLGGRP